MLEVLLLVALVALVALVLMRRKRSPGAGAHTVEGRAARASKLAAEQAVIQRQGGQGAGQGGVGGMGF